MLACKWRERESERECGYTIAKKCNVNQVAKVDLVD